MRHRAFSSCCTLLGLLVLFVMPFSSPKAWGIMHESVPCSSCHAQVAGQVAGGSSNDQGLPNSTVCLSCHDAIQDASGLNPPYVVNGQVELAGGSFTPTLYSDRLGHNIQSVDKTLGLSPPGGVSMSELSCLSCHDPHDNGNYRSLKTEINGYRTQVQASGDPNYQENIYISGMSQFCGACHQKFYGGRNLRGARGWLMHPVGITISGARHSDFRGWSSKNNKVTLVENPSGNPNNLRGAQVFCLSCHRAHASPFDSAMRWDYRRSTQGCLECHSSTSTTGTTANR
jgi:predicted CXXCH cytochrome family protein